MDSKNWCVWVGIIIILVGAIIGGYIYYEGQDKSSYKEYHFELEMESEKETTVYWPIPYDAEDEEDESYGNLSKIVYNLKITSGEGSISVSETKYGRALEVKFNGYIKIEQTKTLFEEEFDNINGSSTYHFDEMTMKNATDSKGESYFVYSSTKDVHVVHFNSHDLYVVERDSVATCDKNVRDLTLKKGWQSIEFW